MADDQFQIPDHLSDLRVRPVTPPDNPLQNVQALVTMYGPNGTAEQVPRAEAAKYGQQGYTLTPKTEFEKSHEGGGAVAALKEFVPEQPTTLKGAVKQGFESSTGMLVPLVETIKNAPGNIKAGAASASEVSPPDPISQVTSKVIGGLTGAVGPVVSMDPQAARAKAERGDTSGILTQAAVPTAMAVAGPLAREVGGLRVGEGINPEAGAVDPSGKFRGLRVRVVNASGESAASQEAINRAASEKSQGIQRVSIDTRSGKEMPLFGPDAVDAKPSTPYHTIVQRGPQGDTILAEGDKARPLPSQSETKVSQTGKPATEENVPERYDLGEIDEEVPKKPEFKEWFGDSKITDESGKPLRVYHGTRASEDFEKFSTDGPPYDDEGNSLTSSSGDPNAYMGAHFAKEPEVAGKFAAGSERWMKGRYSGEAEKPRVIPAYLKLENPIHFANEDALQDFVYEGKMEGYHGDALLEEAMRADGIEPETEESDAWLEKYDNDVDFRKEQNRWIFENVTSDSDAGDTAVVDAAADFGRDAKNRLQKMGHDGVSYKNKIEGGTGYIAFDEDQIRHALTEGPKPEAKTSPKSIIESQGLVYKGELSPGSGVHMMEHPDHPGKTAAMKEADLTPDKVREKMGAKLKEFGTEEKKNLPDVGENSTRDLSHFTDTLHHDTNVYNALAMIPGGGVSSGIGDLYFSNTPELATGQGGQTGVRLEFDSKGIKGQVNRSKPMWEPAYKQGSAEFRSRYNDQKTLQNNLKAVEIRKDLKSSKGEAMRLKDTLARLEKQGWKKTTTEDGVRYERPAGKSSELPQEDKEKALAGLSK